MFEKYKLAYSLISNVLQDCDSRDDSPAVDIDGRKHIGSVEIFIEEISKKDLDLDVITPDRFPVSGKTTTIDEVNRWRETSFYDRLETYKKLEYWYRDYYKQIVFGVDYALYVYSLNQHERLQYKIEIKPNFLGHADQPSAFAIATINGIWKLLDYQPEYKCIPQLVNSELVVNENFIPRWVSKNPELDQDEADSWMGIDDELYEKGCVYQWIVRGEQATTSSDS